MKTLVPESLFSIKLRTEDFNFIKKEALAQVSSREFCEISKNTIFTENLWGTASEQNLKSFLSGHISATGRIIFYHSISL